jgi:tRNA nucleotidyltransferase (CCA-adding enzyme)
MMERELKLKDIDDFERMFNIITKRGDCLSIMDLKVTGKDLIEEGISPGPDLGRILDEMFEDVLDEPSHNTKEWLLSRLYHYTESE